ncbi:unnamed protein product [Aphanomyces euteiches]
MAMRTLAIAAVAAFAHAATTTALPKESQNGPRQYLTVRDQNKDQTDRTKRPTLRVDLDPTTQNIPANPALAHLRPPEPRIPPTFDIFVGISAFRDGIRCGTTLLTAFQRADHPDRVFFGVVDQVHPGDDTCLDSYCQQAAAVWPNETTCRYKQQITVDTRPADESRGPTLARHYQQRLVGNQEFCLQVDAHSAFTKHWDTELVRDWNATSNEMAILSTYIHNINQNILPDGTNKHAAQSTHLCQTKRGGFNNVRNVGADLIYDSTMPQMSALWGAGYSFGKCHAEKRVPVDSHTPWVFDGEEFQRASHLWTYGYDMYSPSVKGLMVYHNYTAVPAKFYQLPAATAKERSVEQERSNNRIKFLLGIPFQGEIDAEELSKYTYGPVRSLASYLKFAGVEFGPNATDNHSCYQLHWVPFELPETIEALLPGWRMSKATPKPTEVASTAATRRHKVETKKLRQQTVEMDRVETPEYSSLSLVVLVCVIIVLVSAALLRENGRFDSAKTK